MKYTMLTVSLFIVAAVWGCGPRAEAAPPKAAKEPPPMSKPVQKTDSEWRKILTPDQYKVLRGQCTETPFTGKYHDHHEKGVYICAACGTPLFDSATKFESGSGWPSFYQPVKTENVEEVPDNSHGMVRTEVRCRKCGGHLGHVFDDGPRPTGLRYCINSASLDFRKK